MAPKDKRRTNVAGELFSPTTSDDAQASEERDDFNVAMSKRIIALLSDQERVSRLSMFALADAMDVLEGKSKRQGVGEIGAPPFLANTADKAIADNQSIDSPSPADLNDATAFDDVLNGLDAANRFDGGKKSARESGCDLAQEQVGKSGLEIAITSFPQSCKRQYLRGSNDCGSKFESKTTDKIGVALAQPSICDGLNATPPGAGGPPGGAAPGESLLNAFGESRKGEC